MARRDAAVILAGLSLGLAVLACARSDLPPTADQRTAAPAPTLTVFVPPPAASPTRPAPTPTETQTRAPTAWPTVPSVTATATPTGTDVPVPTPTLGYAYLSGITAHAREIFVRGQRLGNRPNVFSKVGDSITASAVFLFPIGNGNYTLYDQYAPLEPVIRYFSTEAARGPYNSFNNPPLAAKTNWRAATVFNPASADPDACQPGEAPLPCEYRWVRPSIALIMLGTNDAPLIPPATYERDLRRVIEYSLDQGVIPVISTLPHLARAGYEGNDQPLDAVIVRLAAEYDIPLWDYASALEQLPDHGLHTDGIHPSWAPVGHSADFSPEYLQYGMTVRNLMALEMLNLLWRDVIQSP